MTIISSISSLLRFVLAGLTIISLLLGILLAGIGIWLMKSKNLLRSILNLVDTSKIPAADKGRAEVEALVLKYDLISSVGIAILVIGLFIAAIAFCGGLGSICNIRILLLVYIIATGVLFSSLLVALIYFGTLKARFANEIKTKLAEFQENYLVSLIAVAKNEDSAKTSVTVALNFMHVSLKCCGISEIGDTRYSTSWLASERSLMELAKNNAPVKMGDGQAIPQWLKETAPAGLTKLPAGISKFPAELPQGFSLPPDFKQRLGDMMGASNLTASNFDKLMNDSLTIKTPITCCELGVDIAQGSIDVKTVYEKMKNSGCPFSEVNAGVNMQTCHKAYLDYITHYQHFVISAGTILAIVIGFGLMAAIWIFCCEDRSLQ